ncbi:MAG: metallophosphoesterase [Hyphomicrobium sp.]|uniref:metallophosphoesterase family protein n=1 Tax=Hyphomicrobium sp. TaxID=82 RepID=UPI0039E563E3
MKPIVDPRDGDAEDDASSTKRRTLMSLAGTLLSEISLPKLLAAWIVLIVIPAIMLGAGPLLTSIWIGTVSSKAAAIFSELFAPVVLLLLLLIGWFGGRSLWRFVETNFWSLNALAVQPGYALIREAVRQVAEGFLTEGGDQHARGLVRAGSAAVAGLLIFTFSAWIFALVWPHTRWTGTVGDLSTPMRLVGVALWNSVAIVTAYLAAAGLSWGVADTIMAQPEDFTPLPDSSSAQRLWRVAHLSDIHTVGEKYGFRIEGGRSGPRGNDRLRQVFEKLDAAHAQHPLDLIVISGDVTDAGRATEWAEFLDLMKQYPRLAELTVILPGNHDLNVVDRANPARLDLPFSPNKRLREVRALSSTVAVQGRRVRVFDDGANRLGTTLQEWLAPFAERIVSFADTGALRQSWNLADVWPQSFPMVLPPPTPEGLGVILLDSNAETHFSFTNALGLVTTEQMRATEKIFADFPKASWIVALHHHVVEYPKASKALSERIGTALINGSWFVRRMQRYGTKIVVMHGHRHIDWIGRCGELTIVSAPSPVMDVTDDKDTYFYIHNLGIGPDERLMLFAPERVVLSGVPKGRSAIAAHKAHIPGAAAGVLHP